MPRQTKLLRRSAILGLLASSAVATPAFADPPSIFNMFRKKAPVPTGPYELKPEHGPWLVMATVVTHGDQVAQAKKLAEEIRQSLRLPAFVMQREGGTPERLGSGQRVRQDFSGQFRTSRVEAKYIHGGVQRGAAVLVGEFASDKDPRIAEVLKKIRSFKPNTLSPVQLASATSEVNVDAAVQLHSSRLRANYDKSASMLARAFVTRNPLLPDEYFLESPVLDDFVANLNKGVKYSLLDCPGKYTVRVASFTGKEITGFGKPKASTIKETTDILDRAALRAHQLTVKLRDKNVEAYEFHDKYGSYVSIGSFDSIGQEVNGQFQYNPEMARIAQKYCGYKLVNARDPRTGAVQQMRTLKDEGKIPFDPEGKPMIIPRRAQRVYGGALLGGRR